MADMHPAERILRNACAAVNDRKSVPQPHGKIVAKLYQAQGDERELVPIEVDRLLEVIAWLLAGAEAADPNA